MSGYVAPNRELGFVINELLGYERLLALPAFAEAQPELTQAVLDEAGRLAAEVFAPLNRVGDQQGVRVEGDAVFTADGFKEAYRLFVEKGWMSLAQDPAYGGQGLPYLIHSAACEMWNSACTSLAICPLLTAGALDTLAAHATPELRQQYMPNLVSGRWTATMNLTEPHAGSDLSQLKTRAKPDGAQYRLRGQKIFITWGEHDLAENIIHIVLAPMEDAPPGNKGLSLFLVPKFLVNADGSLGERNDLRVVSTEHKLGIHASPTCVMSYGEKDGAIGYLIGQPGDGLACMFTLMNHARIEVGLQGMALAERAYQGALAYARERVQGRDVETGEPAAIIRHADVQRMLMQMRSMTEAMRALAYDGAYQHDLRTHGRDDEEKRRHEERFALLTPVIKAWSSELVNEVTSIGVQVHGGMGFIEEAGAAQHYRDARIAAIYEGTNGIQANDLVGRKILRDQGAALGSLAAEMRETAGACRQQGHKALGRLGASLEEAVAQLEAGTRFLLEEAASSQRFVGAVAYNYLMALGYVCGAWYMARAAAIAVRQMEGGAEDAFYRRKLESARFYFTQLLPRHKGHLDAVREGAEVGVALSEASF